MSSYIREAVGISEHQLRPEDEACPICAGKKRSKVCPVQRSPDIWLLHCHGCLGCSASRMPTDEALETLYKTYYRGSHERRESGASITFDRPERLARHIQGGLTGPFPENELKLMDYGGGDGTISLLLAKRILDEGKCRKVRVVILDASGITAETHDPRIAIERSAQIGSPEPSYHQDNQYDVVIASAVLEHIPYPADLFRALLRSLKPGGLFYARTPFVVPLLRLVPLSAVRKSLFTYPFHVHDMGQAFWNTVLDSLELTNFKMLRSAPSIVERTFGEAFAQALAAHLLKAPWYVFRNRYNLVGGWEVFIQKTN